MMSDKMTKDQALEQSVSDLEKLYNAQCQCTDDWAEKVEALKLRVAELEENILHVTEKRDYFEQIRRTCAEMTMKLTADNVRLQSECDRLAGKVSAIWMPIVKAGQVSIGDKLRFKIGDKEYRETAKEILHKGTDKEEVIYKITKNFYFITSMVISGFSNHKSVEVLEQAK